MVIDINKTKIVAFGGGNAMPKTVLAGLKNYDVDITSVTSMVDSGGSTGQLRKDFNVLSPGDIRRHLMALSNAPQWKKSLFGFRFGREEFEGGHRGHSFGNIFLAGLECVLQDYEKVLEIVHEFLEVKGRCLPATIEKTHVYAVLENGEIIEGEDEIDVPRKHDGNLKIKKIFLKPAINGYPPALDAITQGDLIIIGPGDLYSSILPCFLPKGIPEAIQASKAKKIFICPPMTKFGETNEFLISDFVNEVEKYLGCKLDHIIYNSDMPSEERVNKYKEEEPTVLKVIEANSILDERFVSENLLVESGPITYDPNKLSSLITNLGKDTDGLNK